MARANIMSCCMVATGLKFLNLLKLRDMFSGYGSQISVLLKGKNLISLNISVV
jgi:hypothetical protein